MNKTQNCVVCKVKSRHIYLKMISFLPNFFTSMIQYLKKNVTMTSMLS